MYRARTHRDLCFPKVDLSLGLRLCLPQCFCLSFRLGLRLSPALELDGCHENTGQSPLFQIDDVVHTARRAATSIGQGFDHRLALNGNLLAQIFGRGLGEGRFTEALDMRSLLTQARFQLVEKDVATSLGDVEQAHFFAL